MSFVASSVASAQYKHLLLLFIQHSGLKRFWILSQLRWGKGRLRLVCVTHLLQGVMDSQKTIGTHTRTYRQFKVVTKPKEKKHAETWTMCSLDRERPQAREKMLDSSCNHYTILPTDNKDQLTNGTVKILWAVPGLKVGLNYCSTKWQDVCPLLFDFAMSLN